MNRRTLLWLSAIAALALVVAYQTLGSSAGRHADEFAARAGVPTVQPGADVLAGIAVLPKRIHRYDYRRSAFGHPWDDRNDAPGGHNGCDTRDDILDRDLVDKTYVSIKRCPNAVATGTLRDPYTNTTVAFQRGASVGQSVQIDHIVPLSYAWDMGAYRWPNSERMRFANDPANLLAVQGRQIRTRAIRHRPNGCHPTRPSPVSTRCNSSPCCAAIHCQWISHRPTYCVRPRPPARRASPRADGESHDVTRRGDVARFTVGGVSGAGVGQWILAHPGAVIEPAQCIHVFGRQLEVEDVEVAGDALGSGRADDHRIAQLQVPPQQHLCGRLDVFAGD